MSHASLLAALRAEISKVFKGHPDVIDQALACFLARGHLLIEDAPGVGKTLLAQALARALGLGFKRVQMTPDLMPADITGGLLWIPQPGRYEFRPGPIFAEIVLLDELNRASSKTQSAVLQAMEERQVSVDGQDHALAEAFFLIATQNSREDAGVNRLPASQLDRFALKIAIGVTAPEDERAILRLDRREKLLAEVHAVAPREELRSLQEAVDQVTVSDAVVDHVLALARHLREKHGHLSTRAAQSLLALARARAFLKNRDFVVPEDARALLPEAWSHRLGASAPTMSAASGAERAEHVQEALRSVRVL